MSHLDETKIKCVHFRRYCFHDYHYSEI